MDIKDASTDKKLTVSTTSVSFYTITTHTHSTSDNPTVLKRLRYIESSLNRKKEGRRSYQVKVQCCEGERMDYQ